MNIETAAPFYPLTETNHAGWVVIASLVFLVYALLGLVAKIVLRFNITSLKYYDLLLVFATVLFILQTICILLAADSGLGQHLNTLSETALVRYNKLIYASNILALIIMGCTKLSLCLLINAINSHGSILNFKHMKHGINQGRLHVANFSQFLFILAWMATGILAVVFQCSLPSPWQATNRVDCPARGSIHVYNGIMNILTDLSLCILPIAMMWKVNTTTAKKLQVVLLFGTRIIVPITAIPALTRAGYLFSNNTDDTWAAVIPTIWFQISLSLSILTACIPSMKSLIDSLMGSTAGATVQAPYELRDIEINGKKKVRATAPDITGSRSTSVKMSSITKGKGSFRIHQHNTSGNPRQNYYFETHGTKPTRSDSMTDLTEGVILRSDQFEVQYEDGGTGSSLHESLDDHLSKAAWKRDA